MYIYTCTHTHVYMCTPHTDMDTFMHITYTHIPHTHIYLNSNTHKYKSSTVGTISKVTVGKLLSF